MIFRLSEEKKAFSLSRRVSESICSIIVAEMDAPKRPYHKTYRRMLLDMHIPDWHPDFLRDYDPEKLASTYADANVEGVLLYCKSHMGHNYWPCPVGSIHPKAQNRDFVGELFNALKARGIAPAAYHTVVFDNWAVLNHPEWKNQPLFDPNDTDLPFLMGRKYGTACPNNPDYRQYEASQIRALLEKYDFDTLFIDMTFWTGVCACQVCRERFRKERGDPWPEVIDWNNPQWAAFQLRREAWLEEFIIFLMAEARKVRPTLAIVHNMGPGTHGWFTGQKIDFSQLDTYVAGDIYGGRGEQLVISKMMLHVGKEQPAEFMTTRTVNLHNHVALKSEYLMLLEALATYAHHCAFIFIDAIDPRGTIVEGVYQRIRRIFGYIQPYEKFLGGVPVEDVMLYYSDDSRVDPGFENGLSVRKANSRKDAAPHLIAIYSAAHQLQKAQISFGVFTKHSLSKLQHYKVVVLPDLIRITLEEVEAFRNYVRNGGRLYASGRTSLLTSDGHVQADFLLADVLGVEFEKMETGAGVFIKASSPVVVEAVSPESYLGVGFTDYHGHGAPPLGLPRLSTKSKGKVLATLNVPYGYPAPGALGNQDFASIHSSPPWDDLNNPAIVENRFHRGKSIYSISPIETALTEADKRLFVSLIRDLLEGPGSLEAEASPDTWVTLFDQPEQRRYVVTAVVYNPEFNPGPTPLKFAVHATTPGRQIDRVVEASSGREVKFDVGKDGAVQVDDGPFELFRMYLLEYHDEQI